MKTTSLILLASLALASCVKGGSCTCGRQGLDVRGAALMDDSTLWDPARVAPDMDSIEERDWAFTALGGMNTARLAVKADYFMGHEGEVREQGFEFLERQLAFAEKYRLRVVLDMHIPPGGAIQDYRVTPGSEAFWHDEALKLRFVATWAEIARRFAKDRRIWAFELMNEPSGGPDQYWELMEDTIEAIRAVDPVHLIILQPDRDWRVRKLRDDKLAFSFHFYSPIEFTHQGVADNPRFRDISGVRYPGEAADHSGEKHFYGPGVIMEELSYAAGVARKTGVPVIIGEFGLSTAADEESAGRWIADVLGAGRELGLDGYLYWREIYRGGADISKAGHATMAVIDDGSYESSAQFFGIRPSLAAEDPGFDFAGFYREFGGGR
ncbi:MAG: cellulase family glycosylhydrolase [Proteobacteria bacterium]|nr:cellulase family glycosylhydrolase [Pseudomonadota bacterium]